MISFVIFLFFSASKENAYLKDLNVWYFCKKQIWGGFQPCSFICAITPVRTYPKWNIFHPYCLIVVTYSLNHDKK